MIDGNFSQKKVSCADKDLLMIEKSRVKIQIRDPDTDELLEESIISNDYAVICVGNRYIKSSQVWGSTHQINIAVKK